MMDERLCLRVEPTVCLQTSVAPRILFVCYPASASVSAVLEGLGVIVIRGQNFQ